MPKAARQNIKTDPTVDPVVELSSRELLRIWDADDGSYLASHAASGWVKEDTVAQFDDWAESGRTRRLQEDEGS